MFLSIYAVALSGLIFALFRGRRFAVALALLPVVTAACDLVEDIGLFVALWGYPAPSSTVLTLASVAGVLKFVGFGLTLLLIGGGLVCRAARFLAEEGRYMYQDKERSTWQTFLALRSGMVLLVVMLFTSVVVQALEHAPDCFQHSISAYYFSGARAVFVGTLCAIGVCLIVYRGNTNAENVLLDYSGFMAFFSRWLCSSSSSPASSGSGGTPFRPSHCSWVSSR